MAVNPRIELLPSWTSAGVRQVVPMSGISAAFDSAFQVVAQAVEAAGVGLAGPAYACYFGTPTDVLDVEIGFGISGTHEVPGLVVRDNPETRAVIGTHVGPYSELESSYAELMPWIAAQGLEVSDVMYELYESEPDVPAEETITQMVFPLAGQ